MAFLTIGTYIWLPAFNAREDQKYLEQSVLMPVTEQTENGLTGEKSCLEVNRLTLLSEMCGKIKLFLFGANLDKAELLIIIVRDIHAI